MLITNEQLAEALNNIADVLEEQDENPYRVRAYRRAAHSVRGYAYNIATLVRKNLDLTVIPHIGKKLSQVLEHMLATKNLGWVPELKIAKHYSKTKLKKSASYKISAVMLVVSRIFKRLSAIPEITRIEIAGDYRRKQEVISEITILIVTSNTSRVMKQFHAFPSIKYILETTKNKTIVYLRFGIQVTLQSVTDQFFSSQLLYATGTSSHYKQLKQIAKRKNINLIRRGLLKNNKYICPSSESDIYHALGLEFVPPELRENRGEIIAATKNRLPKLIELSDVKGDLHCHTNETDGSFTLQEMVLAARTQGYQYVAITDHSKSLRITNGMDEKRLLKQIKYIDRLNEKFSDFTILKSMEVDILEDGTLDLSDDVLKELDLTVCSIHSKFHLSFEKQTERILRAMDNPYFNILGHATGRLIHHRPPYKFDMDLILQKAKDNRCCIEVNAQPARLDINDLYCKRAKDIGVKVAISSDAHTIKGFSFMILGVNQARRGWLEANDVINTYDLLALRKWLKRA